MLRSLANSKGTFMKKSTLVSVGSALLLAAGTAFAQGRGAAAPSANTDIYHIEFIKAAPGQGMAEAAVAAKQDPN